MITLLQSIILGIVQGITEWLPVSSSGHLVIAQQLFNMEVPLSYDILLHFATLIVLFVVFSKDIKEIAMLKNKKLLYLIIIGSIPTAIIGFLFKDLFASFFTSLTVVGIALLVTGLVLFFSEKKEKKKNIGYSIALLIGIAQGLALIPGLSRSGLTIGIALLLGVKNKEAARFSFLLAIPAIIGATFLEFDSSLFANSSLFSSLAGMIMAAIVGYVSLKWLLKLIMDKRFHYFACYCFILGIILVVFF